MFQDLTDTILFGFLTIGVPAAVLYWIFKPAAAVTAPTPALKIMSPAAVRVEFRRRSSRSVRYGFLPIAAGCAMILLGGSLIVRGDRPGIFGSRSLAVTIAVIGLLVFTAGLIFVSAVYRCPVCDGDITDEDGLIFFPSSCPGCGVALK